MSATLPAEPQTDLQALRPYISRALDAALTQMEAEEAFDIIMSGRATPSQIGGFLMILRLRGESIEEIVGAATIMRAKALKVRAPAGAIDIVGTGGDGKGTLNISTAAALVVASLGVPVAKHGNKAQSSKTGTADVLGLLGVNINADVATIERSLAACGIGYMNAPNHHAAMRHVMPARVELGVRTVFNILGPLTNPAGVKRQLTGAFTQHLLRPMAETLRALGSEKAWLVHGMDGTDEILQRRPDLCGGPGGRQGQPIPGQAGGRRPASASVRRDPWRHAGGERREDAPPARRAAVAQPDCVPPRRDAQRRRRAAGCRPHPDADGGRVVGRRRPGRRTGAGHAGAAGEGF